jgi:urease accessory protein
MLLDYGPAAAHHGEGMRVPATWLAGAVGGAAHPVLDVAHLGFLLALGVLAVRTTKPLMLLVVFGIATLGGAWAHLVGIEPLEGRWLAVWIGATALLAGAAVVTRHDGAGPAVAVAVAIAGVLHGSGYAESVEGATPVVLAAYFAGVVVMQSVIACAAFAAMQFARRRGLNEGLRPALGGTAIVLGSVAMVLAAAL